MRFEAFLRALERDLAHTKTLNLIKCTDANARPLLQVRNQKGDTILEVLYWDNGHNKAARAIRGINADGSKFLLCSSGEVMALRIVLYLQRYVTQLPNAFKALRNEVCLCREV